jgi:hypothetical protein
MPLCVGCGDCLLHSLRILPHLSMVHGTKSHVYLKIFLESISKAEGKDHCPLGVYAMYKLYTGSTQLLHMLHMANCTLGEGFFTCYPSASH